MTWKDSCLDFLYSREENLLKRFALLGHPLGHSLSPLIHQHIFDILGIDATYVLEDMEIEDFPRKFPELLSSYSGLNITIPYKEKVQEHLAALSQEALQFGAVNTIYNGKGYNTDIAGFLSADFHYQNKTVLLLGSGGVAKTMLYAVCRLGAKQVLIRVRDKSKDEKLVHTCRKLYPQCAITLLTETDLHAWDGEIHYILNGTPLGMWPAVGELPLEHRYYIERLEKSELEGVFDSIYNPLATRFILLARSYGVPAVSGLPMLFHQALEAQRIWHPELESRFRSPEVKQRLLETLENLPNDLLDHFPLRIVLTGFMASGKSTVARKLAKTLGIPSMDLDQIIEERLGRSITEIFSQHGEDYFRTMEREIFTDLLSQEGSYILSTGGGCLLQEGMEDLVRAHQGQIVYTKISLETALMRAGNRASRPLLQQEPEALRRLYEMREVAYEALADVSVSTEGRPREAVEAILRAFGLE